MAYDDIIAFWFDELEPSQWWKVDTELDRRIARRFGAVHGQATRGELAHWRDSPAGRLAEVLVLDQFSRNIWRNTPKAFAQDAMALVLAQEAVRTQADRAVDIHQRRFFYMPHMHSESAEIHRQAIELFDQPGLEDNLRFELLHRDIIQRFGRYPHRNAILGRPSTQAELEFLQQPGSSF
ncbi:DUF924 family protein [Halopseudomonas sp.]|jgi:uncharacterized protein (DUF924 family)|uniref:DUF924 family protein n=1 Tax=Halopseudomonas sp. TaxID=2901191 RepID=UPI0030034621|tara:strand:+ start:830 stop:1369 length:540 start_codon:yes stop_codon:yes gene_type:complete